VSPASSPPPPRRSARDLLARVDGTVLGDLLNELRRTRVLDIAYTLSAQAFVALIPLVLVATAAFTGPNGDAAVAQQLIARFGLIGAARDAVRVLFRDPGAGSGIYWLGLVITLYSAFSLSRRVARAYTTVWGVPALPAAKQARGGLVWLVIQLVMIVLATSLRTFGKDHGTGLQVLAALVLLVVWAGAELIVQQLLTGGQIERHRLVVAAALVSVGHLLVGAWSGIYLPSSFAHQAAQYGPIGVVFSFFTWIFASALMLLAAVLLAAVFTARPARDWFAHPDPSTTGGWASGELPGTP
jgi:uncharacterized BrkB/YihY/UPF0761 family membrane protein